MISRLLSLAWLSAGAVLADGLAIRWTANHAAIEVSGLSAADLSAAREARWSAEQWAKVFPVHVELGDLQREWDLPAVLGAHSVEEEAIRFTPKFPAEPGVRYRATFRPAALPSGGKPTSVVLEVPPRDLTPSAVVQRVYPSGDVVPENLLKFYVHFSAPMSVGHIYEHIHLRDEAGRDVELPFLEIDEELWDPEMKRLTLFIDPGRIKREVKPLEEVGPALQAGKRFILAIDAAWTDARGAPLREAFTKRFSVGPPDRDPPDPATWKLTIPKAGGSEPMRVAFPEPMDHALSQRVIALVDRDHRRVEGEIALGQGETEWTLTPSRTWAAGSYQLVVGAALEDLAGNNVGKPFEVDLFQASPANADDDQVAVPESQEGWHRHRGSLVKNLRIDGD